MKRKLLITALAFIAVVVAAAAISIRKPSDAYAAEGAGKLTVNGAGSVSVKPDIAYINVGAATENASPSQAQSENTAIMEKVLAAVKSLGIEEKDIQTSEYSIYPKQDYQNGNKIIGYTVTNILRVTVRDLEKTGELLEKTVASGANAGYGISFSIEDSGPAYEQAMDLAIKDAIAKAQAAAKSLGATVGKPIEVIEGGGSYTPVRNAKMVAESAAAAPSIQAGELTISANVTAIFNY
jgi:uncharacterized protein YggE